MSLFPKLFTLTFSANCPLPTLTYAKCVEISGKATQLDSQTVTEEGDKIEKKHEESSLFVVGQTETERNSG